MARVARWTTMISLALWRRRSGSDLACEKKAVGADVSSSFDGAALTVGQSDDNRTSEVTCTIETEVADKRGGVIAVRFDAISLPRRAG